MAKRKAQSRSSKTLEAIMEAAYKVFSHHPYNAASIRMIAKEGGFGHPIIAYYFPTKAELFQAVSEEICRDLFESDLRWLKEVSPLRPSEALALYLERIVAYGRGKPHVFRIIMLNMSQEKVGGVPGQDRLVEVMEGMREALTRILDIRADRTEVARFSDSFNALILYYLGAPESAAWLLGMNPESEEYFQWVAGTMHALCLPLLVDLLGWGKKDVGAERQA